MKSYHAKINVSSSTLNIDFQFRFLTQMVAYCTSSAHGVKQMGRSGIQREYAWIKVVTSL